MVLPSVQGSGLEIVSLCNWTSAFPVPWLCEAQVNEFLWLLEQNVRSGKGEDTINEV